MKRYLTMALSLLTVLSARGAGAEEQGAAPPAMLPLTSLVLYSSGVGYFEHDGIVEGEARMELTFSASQINDLLKSLVLRDFDGGTVRSVSYGSRDPVSRALGSFTIDLTSNPSLAGILEQLRGQEITLLAPDRLTGTVIGVESRAERDEATVTTVFSVTLLGSDGIRRVSLDQIQGFRIARPELEEELREALRLLAASRDVTRRAVALTFSGQGRRRVRVGYILETPVWKTSYRLVLGEGSTHFLQGWAIVENTTDDDWRDVSLSLVSGRPISFTMDLYQPLYVQRPVVEMELYRSLTPRTYEMAVGDKGEAASEGLASLATPSARVMAPSAMPAPAPSRAASGAGPSSSVGGIRLDQGVTAAASAGEVGDLFQYAIEKPVTLPRQQSAMLPIVNQSVTGTRYSIYNETVHAKYPLNALKLKNTSGLSLMQGPITIFDGGVYAGDAQIGNLPPEAEVFLSYSMDLETEVVPASAGVPEELTAVRIARGVLIATYKYRRERSYTVTSRSSRDRTIMIEHPLDSAWLLAEPREPTERTRDTYRFALPVPAGKTRSLTVAEERVASQTLAVTSLANDRIDLFVRSRVASEAVKEAFRRVVTLRQDYQEAAAERQRLEARVQEITRDQQRIRDNMSRLERNSALYNRYVETLGSQEDELEALAGKISAAKEAEAGRKKELDAFTLALEVE